MPHGGSVADDTGTRQDPAEQDPSGQDPPGQDRAGQDRAGQDSTDDDSRRLSPPLIVALALGAALVVGIAVAGIVVRANGSGATGPPPSAVPTAAATGPVALAPVDAPLAGSPGCTALLGALPATLGAGNTALHRRPLAAPAPPATAAWSGVTGDPVVLRCGIARPPELTPTSELLVVDGVSWLRVLRDSEASWYAVDRAACVALTLPANGSTGPIQDVSAAIGAAMPAVPVFGP